MTKEVRPKGEGFLVEPTQAAAITLKDSGEEAPLICIAIPPRLFTANSDDEIWEQAAPILRKQVTQARAALAREDKGTYSIPEDPDWHDGLGPPVINQLDPNDEPY